MLHINGIGSVANDPVLHHTGKGDPIMTIHIKVDNPNRSAERTSFLFGITLMGNVAQKAYEGLNKGDFIYIANGLLTLEEYNNKVMLKCLCKRFYKIHCDNVLGYHNGNTQDTKTEYIIGDNDKGPVRYGDDIVGITYAEEYDESGDK